MKTLSLHISIFEIAKHKYILHLFKIDVDKVTILIFIRIMGKEIHQPYFHLFPE